MRAAGIGAFVASLVVVTGANAQVPFNACLDRQDQPIQAVVDNDLPYAGVATITVDGAPVIFYNKQALSRTSPQARRFVYLHECGHHALRHVWKDPSRLREMEALFGASRRAAAQFSFFLAIPTMFGATTYTLFKTGVSFDGEEWALLAVGSVVSFLVAWAVVAWLMNFIAKRTFVWFGVYRIVLGGVVLLLLWRGLLPG